MSDDKTVEVTVKFELSDVLWAYYKYHYKKIRRILVLASILSVMLGVVFIISLTSDPEAPDGFAGLVAGGLCLLSILSLPVLIVLVMLVAVYQEARKSFTTNKILQETTRYRFSAEGIDEAAPSFSFNSDWATIFEAVETERHFFLFISTNQMHIIPKRCFQDWRQSIPFRDLLKDHLAERAKLKAS